MLVRWERLTSFHSDLCRSCAYLAGQLVNNWWWVPALMYLGLSAPRSVQNMSLRRNYTSHRSIQSKVWNGKADMKYNYTNGFQEKLRCKMKVMTRMQWSISTMRGVPKSAHNATIPDFHCTPRRIFGIFSTKEKVVVLPPESMSRNRQQTLDCTRKWLVQTDSRQLWNRNDATKWPRTR